MVALAGALVLNIGTLTEEWVESMIRAGRKASACRIPVVLDPVGSGATALRTRSARRIIAETRPAVVRGNASEVLSLAEVMQDSSGQWTSSQTPALPEASAALFLSAGTSLALNTLASGKKNVKRLLSWWVMMSLLFLERLHAKT